MERLVQLTPLPRLRQLPGLAAPPPAVSSVALPAIVSVAPGLPPPPPQAPPPTLRPLSLCRDTPAAQAERDKAVTRFAVRLNCQWMITHELWVDIIMRFLSTCVSHFQPALKEWRLQKVGSHC